MTQFDLRIPEAQIELLANRYGDESDDADLFSRVEAVRQRGALRLDDLRAVIRWKAPRAARHVEGNSETLVSEITQFALNAETEESRIQALLILSGVNWPTASVILHFFHLDPYPILDFRALWSVSIDPPPIYGFLFWYQYTRYTRDLANRLNLSMRVLDRALWQFSKENQRPSDAAGKAAESDAP